MMQHPNLYANRELFSSTTRPSWSTAACYEGAKVAYDAFRPKVIFRHQLENQAISLCAARRFVLLLCHSFQFFSPVDPHILPPQESRIKRWRFSTVLGSVTTNTNTRDRVGREAAHGSRL